MIDFARELQSSHCFFKSTKIACGGNYKFLFDKVADDIIHGRVEIQLGNKKHYMHQKWDRYGYPADLTKYPSKYYLRLLFKN